jgi:hypothetical protein
LSYNDEWALVIVRNESVPDWDDDQMRQIDALKVQGMN